MKRVARSHREARRPCPPCLRPGADQQQQNASQQTSPPHTRTHSTTCTLTPPPPSHAARLLLGDDVRVLQADGEGQAQLVGKGVQRGQRAAGEQDGAHLGEVCWEESMPLGRKYVRKKACVVWSGGSVEGSGQQPIQAWCSMWGGVADAEPAGPPPAAHTFMSVSCCMDRPGEKHQ